MTSTHLQDGEVESCVGEFQWTELIYTAISNCKGDWGMKYECIPGRKKGNNKVVSASVSNASKW